MNTPQTVQEAVAEFMSVVGHTRSKETHRIYKYALKMFCELGELAGDTPLPTMEKDGHLALENALSRFLTNATDLSISSEKTYLGAISSFMSFVVAEEMAPVNIPRIKNIIKYRARQRGQRLPVYDHDLIAKLLHELKNAPLPSYHPLDRLRLLRDKAMIFVLATTGLRNTELRKMKWRDFDLRRGRIRTIGKGDKEAFVNVPPFVVEMVVAYHQERVRQEPHRSASEIPNPQHPVFTTHSTRMDIKKLPHMSATDVYRAVQERALALVGEEGKTIHPHSFRHYFITTVLQKTGNLRMAQELARHQRVETTSIYTHLIDSEKDRVHRNIFGKLENFAGTLDQEALPDNEIEWNEEKDEE